MPGEGQAPFSIHLFRKRLVPDRHDLTVATGTSPRNVGFAVKGY